MYISFFFLSKGYLLDKTAKNYKSVFILAASYYAFALACYVPMKLLLIKNWYNNKDDQISRSEYTQFENENDPVNQDGTNNHFNNHNIEQENYEKNESSVWNQICKNINFVFNYFVTYKCILKYNFIHDCWSAASEHKKIFFLKLIVVLNLI